MKQTEKVRGMETTLDKLPYGSEDRAEMHGKAGRPTLPEGVERKTLARDVALLTWPSLLELILTQLTSLVDQIMVGRIPGELGVAALAAVGLANQPKFLLMTAIQALNVGATAIIARYRGQQNREKANQAFRHALLLNLVISALLMVVGLFAAEWMVRFMGTNSSAVTIQNGTEYLRIQLYGLIPLCLTFTMTAALRGTGNTRVPLIYNTVANGVNVVFNYMLIYGKCGFPAMGVAGASLATVIGQTVAFAIAVGVVMKKNSYVCLSFKEKFTFDTVILSNIVRIGMPAMAEQLLMRIGMIIFVRTVTGLGDLKYATHQIVLSIQSFSFMIGQAFATASTTLVGQSLGRRRYDMAVIYLRQTQALGRVVSGIVMVLVLFLRGGIVSLFTTDVDVIALGSQIMILVALCQPVQADQFIITGALRGAGDTRFTALAMMVTVLGVRCILSLFLVNVLDWGLWGAWAAIASDQIIRTVMVALRFRSGAWKRVRLKEAKS